MKPEIQLEAAFPVVERPDKIRRYLTLLPRRLVLASLFLLVSFRQHSSQDGLSSALYDPVWGGFRRIDLLLLGVFYVHGLWILATRQRMPRMPKSLKRPALLFFGAVGIAYLYGLYQQGEHLYFDWREIVLGVGLGLIFICWIKTAAALQEAVRVFAFVMSTRIFYLLVSYAVGRGVEGTVPGLVTPVFDGPTLDAAVLLALLAFRFCSERQTHTYRAQKIWWMIAGAGASLLVLLSFRRTFWGEMVVGTLVLVAFLGKKYIATLVPLLVMLGLVVVVADRRFYLRAESLDPFADKSQYAITNEDHVGDVLDAFDQVKEHPVLGIGLGRPYTTYRIRAWKTESSEVHNALLHVWVFYGLVGLVAYIWFHASLFRWLKQLQATHANPGVRVFCQVGLAYLFGQFLMTCAFTPWFYGELQTNILIFFVVGSCLSLQRGTVGGESERSNQLTPMKRW
jgi:hypothetical protein